MTIVFPSSYMSGRRVDEAFEREYEAAMAAGFDIALFQQQFWDERQLDVYRGGRRRCVRSVRGAGSGGFLSGCEGNSPVRRLAGNDTRVLCMPAG